MFNLTQLPLAEIDILIISSGIFISEKKFRGFLLIKLENYLIKIKFRLLDYFSFLDFLIPLMRLGVVTCLEASCIHSKQ